MWSWLLRGFGSKFGNIKRPFLSRQGQLGILLVGTVCVTARSAGQMPAGQPPHHEVPGAADPCLGSASAPLLVTDLVTKFPGMGEKDATQ